MLRSIVLVLFLACSAQAIDLDDGGAYFINGGYDESSVNLSNGTTFTIQEGGIVRGFNGVTAYDSSRVVIEGSESDLENRNNINLRNNSVLDMLDGNASITARGNSLLSVTGHDSGTSSLSLSRFANASIEAGNWSGITASDDSVLRLKALDSITSPVRLHNNATLVFHGSNFNFPGTLVDPFLLAGTVEGIFIDGSVFSIPFQRHDLGTKVEFVISQPEPSTLAMLAPLLMLRRRR